MTLSEEAALRERITELEAKNIQLEEDNKKFDKSLLNLTGILMHQYQTLDILVAWQNKVNQYIATGQKDIPLYGLN